MPQVGAARRSRLVATLWRSVTEDTEVNEKRLGNPSQDGGTPSESHGAQQSGGLSKRLIALIGLALVLVVGALIAVGFAVGWSFSDSIGVAALVVSVIGFVVAICEIHRARIVSITTQGKVDKALRKVEAGRLQTAVAELRGLASNIEEACDQGDMKSFRILSEHWRDLAGSTIALVDQWSGGESEVVADLKKARRLGREANQAMHEKGKTLRENASDFLSALAIARDALPQLAEELLTTMEPSDE